MVKMNNAQSAIKPKSEL